jgi:hypothetical protein
VPPTSEETHTSLPPSGRAMMPRGRRAVGMVLIYCSVLPSITVTVLSFSLET